ncbi:MAG: helix-turn-helix domain-containing protein [Clostridia bacterium]|nr:helix-turn-helix domain-containing protein [Clostridia bacterium]
MIMLFAEVLKKLRRKKGLSQSDIAKQMYVTKSTVSRWENGTRLPDATMISRLAEILDVDVNYLLYATTERDESPNIIMVDDNAVILNGGLPVIKKVLPNARVTGFTKPSEAIDFAKQNRVALAFLDIEMGAVSGLDVCRELLEINQHTNVVYLTAYSNYSLDAWETGACGFMLKPITVEAIKTRLDKLRFPFLLGGEK